MNNEWFMKPENVIIPRYTGIIYVVVCAFLLVARNKDRSTCLHHFLKYGFQVWIIFFINFYEHVHQLL